MLQIEITDRWHAAFPGAHVGMLLIGNVDNTPCATSLDQHKRELESRLRARYAGYDRAALHRLPVLHAYRAYYKRFGKTYHVQLQLESIVHQGKRLPGVSPLVDANFAAELETLVLTAGHDADLLAVPLTIDASEGDETFTQLSGVVRTLKPNDMIMTDAGGVVCAIIYGQDARTPISPRTRRALYMAYAPAGVPVTSVQQQLDLIHQNILLATPDATVEMTQVIAATEATARVEQATECAINNGATDD